MFFKTLIQLYRRQTTAPERNTVMLSKLNDAEII